MKILKFVMNEVGEMVQLADDQDMDSFIGRLVAGHTELVKTIAFGVDTGSIADLVLKITDFDPELTISINGGIIKKGDSISVHKGILTPGFKSEPIRVSIQASRSIEVAEGKQHKIGLKLSYLYPGR